jgi:molecular chaperone DnaJ
MSRNDLYIILDITQKASVNDIKRAFRKLARRYHPDINPGDRSAEEQFKRITEAYEVLSDPSKRQFYDRNGFYSEGVLDEQPPPKRPSWSFSFEGFDFSRPPQSPAAELFSQFFTRQPSQRQPEPGRDVEYQMSVGFEESMHGLRTRISVQRQHPCSVCSATGVAAGAEDGACRVCGGTGAITRTKGRLQFAVPCADCAGAGRNLTRCGECGGEGRVVRTDIVDVEIPAGVGAGSRIRLAGGGDAGRFGGPPGDLFVITNVGPHPFFNRAGDNIRCALPITFVEAALGAKVEVPTIDGPAIVRIPPGTQNGQVFRLRDKGAPSLIRPGMRGDQFVEVRVIVPRIGDERSKEILREFARLNDEDPRREIAATPSRAASWNS